MSDLLPGLDVSRETMQRLEVFQQLLMKWSPKINLVSNSTIQNSWDRHILDSAQLFMLFDQADGHWLDLGAGGGFPGLVIAILRAELAPQLKVTLVESDQRKCVFLRQVLRETGVVANVLAERIEALEPQNATVLSARALADLETLLGFAERHMAEDGTALFLKGVNWRKELTAARESWNFSCCHRRSVTDPNAVVLSIGALAHV
ncbi:16S rRNA (guanine(527)-N(7))-methyltransferase RsmG [Salipiger sp. 1_MG-2023]|uniref:16S rRNA (guanine(527)-N(7))-methyltransferase RsmG n=1 Tax=Salipiger sp. 1_MG-2023 TaxID=3062665 RepID=UPI0026E14859|nr:16S rRNA (guanine(527)-N(7))-methyltransferase RsmG [Salipiger sp. 1_MG-2023]MDO6586441.1 16S rRNA (guanine(527)-N(7))-methyltransferase RsmG [Salipiger sp. 1_MG-2023]